MQKFTYRGQYKPFFQYCLDGKIKEKQKIFKPPKGGRKERRMKRIKFEVGKTYSCVSLYGGFLFIRVVDRTEDTVSFVYTDDEDGKVTTQKIEIQECCAYGHDLEVVGKVETECTLAWTYHSSYADPDDLDYGYYFAFDDGELYTPEAFEQL